MNTRKELRTKKMDFNLKVSNTDQEEQRRSINDVLLKHNTIHDNLNAHIKKELQSQEEEFAKKMSRRLDRSANKSMNKSTDKKPSFLNSSELNEPSELLDKLKIYRPKPKEPDSLNNLDKKAD